ncbi:MAG: ATP-binding protein, partial [Chloroflexi bacterium]
LHLSLPEEPAILQGDWASLRKALIHILDNAITYNKPQGEVRVTLSQEEGVHLITVADTGIGIPQVELSRIFEPFYQVEEHNTRRYGGLGLGLAIARRAVELHGGRIWAESRLNEGSTFYIALPTPNGSATNGNEHPF